MPLKQHFAEEFVQQWVKSWNAKDLDACAKWLDNDVETISSYVAKLFPDSFGKIKGKESLLKYFSFILDVMPNFTLTEPQFNIIGNTIMLSSLNGQSNEVALIGYSFSDKGKIINIKASL